MRVILSLVVLAMSVTAFAKERDGVLVQKFCTTDEFDHDVSVAKNAMKLAKVLKGKTMVLFEPEVETPEFKGIFPLKISAKILDQKCVEVSALAADPDTQIGIGGGDIAVDFSTVWTDISVGDDGRAHYLVQMYKGFDVNDDICNKDKKGKYKSSGTVGVVLNEWSSNVYSTGLNACFE